MMTGRRKEVRREKVRLKIDRDSTQRPMTHTRRIQPRKRRINMKYI
jgi:hypothetical protein